MKEEEKYVTRLYRKDGVTIDCLVSSSFTECKELWKKLHSQWTNCHKEQEVFIIENPQVTAFEPGLVSEIAVLPYRNVLNNIEDDNPYKSEMMNRGLSQTLRGAGGHGDLLDRGYS